VARRQTPRSPLANTVGARFCQIRLSHGQVFEGGRQTVRRPLLAPEKRRSGYARSGASALSSALSVITEVTALRDS
jgi:hypothetical protein